MFAGKIPTTVVDSALLAVLVLPASMGVIDVVVRGKNGRLSAGETDRLFDYSLQSFDSWPPEFELPS